MHLLDLDWPFQRFKTRAQSAPAAEPVQPHVILYSLFCLPSQGWETSLLVELEGGGHPAPDERIMITDLHEVSPIIHYPLSPSQGDRPMCRFYSADRTALPNSGDQEHETSHIIEEDQNNDKHAMIIGANGTGT